MSFYKAAPLSRSLIKEFAMYIRKVLEIGSDESVGYLLRFEGICNALGIKVEITEDHELSFGRYAEMDIFTGNIKVKESVYQRARKGCERGIFTLYHELGHSLYHRNNLVLCRDDKLIKKYEDPEWQANTFAAEFLVPHEFAKILSVSEISSRYGVSYQVASIQKKKYQ